MRGGLTTYIEYIKERIERDIKKGEYFNKLVGERKKEINLIKGEYEQEIKSLESKEPSNNQEIRNIERKLHEICSTLYGRINDKIKEIRKESESESSDNLKDLLNKLKSEPDLKVSAQIMEFVDNPDFTKMARELVQDFCSCTGNISEKCKKVHKKIIDMENMFDRDKKFGADEKFALKEACLLVEMDENKMNQFIEEIKEIQEDFVDNLPEKNPELYPTMLFFTEHLKDKFSLKSHSDQNHTKTI